MTAVWLAIGSALAWSGLDAMRKRLASRIDPVPLVVMLGLLQAPVFAGWATVQDTWSISSGYLVPGGLCLLGNVVANLLFVQAVRVSPLSLTVPFLSLTPVFTAAVANPILGETPTGVQIIGIVTVVVGALLLNAGAAGGLGLGALARAFARERGSVLMTITAVLWSVTGVLDKLSMQHAPVPVHGLIQTGGVGLSLVLVLAARSRISSLRQNGGHAGSLVAALGFAAAGYGLQLLAMQTMLVALVETIKRAIGMIASVVVGRVWFDEPVTSPKLVAIVLMSAGTTLVALA